MSLPIGYPKNELGSTVKYKTLLFSAALIYSSKDRLEVRITENFIICFNAVFPIFAIMAVGCVCRLRGLIGEKEVEKMNKLAFTVFLPVTLFHDIYNSELSAALRPRLVLFAAVGIPVLALLSVAVTLLLVKNKNKQGVMIQALFRSNFAIIGVPLAGALMNGGDISAVAVLLAIVVPINNVLSVVLLAMFNGKKAEPRQVLLGVVKNPLIIGCVLGLLFTGLKIKLPVPVESTVSSMAKVGSPLMMFLLGAFFQFSSLGRQKWELVLASAGRLLIIPAVFLGVAYGLGFKGVEMAALIAVFASPAAVSSFTMAQQMGGDSELAGDIVVATSALCPFTIFFWCMLLKILGAL